MITFPPINIPFSLESQEWLEFFNDIGYALGAPNWDSGPFVPEFTGLASSNIDNVTIEGNFVRHGKILHFDVLIDPNGETVTASLGTTFFGLPGLLQARSGNQGVAKDTISAQGYGRVEGFDVNSPLDLGAGYVDIDTLDAYVPAFSGSNKISLTGWVRIQGI